MADPRDQDYIRESTRIISELEPGILQFAEQPEAIGDLSDLVLGTGTLRELSTPDLQSIAKCACVLRGLGNQLRFPTGRGARKGGRDQALKYIADYVFGRLGGSDDDGPGTPVEDVKELNAVVLVYLHGGGWPPYLEQELGESRFSVPYPPYPLSHRGCTRNSTGSLN